MIEEQLDKGRHDRAAFSCGIVELDEFLRKHANQHKKKGVSTTYVLADDRMAEPLRIVGYYTLSMAQIELTDLPRDLEKKLPRHPVPCIRMGRLAVAQHYHGQRYGERLIGLAVNRCRDLRQQIAAFALIVDAKPHAIAFYRKYGFQQFASQPDKLFLH